MAYSIADLEGCFDKLPAKDKDFAQSLIKNGKRAGGLTSKQGYWVDRLTKAAKGELAVPAQVDVGSLIKAIALFDRASQHLKYPKIILTVDADHEVKLSVAGASAKVPGSINVAANAKFGQGDWYGRITRDGVFHPTPNVEKLPHLIPALQAFAANPAKVAAEYGHLTGHCCFCLRKLDDERSTSVGYGPVCADHFGLPWGSKNQSQEEA